MADRKEAPGELNVVRSFVNTIDLEDGDDDIASPDGLRTWLESNGLAASGVRPTREDVARAAAVREALRALMLANAGEEGDPHATRTLDEAAERARLTLRFDAHGRSRLEPAAGGVDGALGRILARVADAMSEGTWSRLKACRADNCQWAFYDSTKNRSGRWCDMAVCGNREKVRAFRERRGG